MRKLIIFLCTIGLCVPAFALADSGSPSAQQQCATERTAMGADAFKALYGTNANKSNAFGKCVSGKAKAAESADVKATDNAAKACWSERQADAAAFKAKYGTGPNKSNAFGKCVSGKVKHSK